MTVLSLVPYRDDSHSGAHHSAVGDLLEPANKPVVVVNATTLTDQADTVQAALKTLYDSRAVYGHGDDIVRVLDDPDDGRAHLQPLNVDSLSGIADRAISFVRENSKGEQTPVYPPPAVMRLLLTDGGRELPRLRQLLAAPAILPDGRVLTVEGYDTDSGIYLRYPRGFEPPTIPCKPSQDEANAALEMLRDVYYDFPFQSDADFDNAIGELVGVVTRSCRPLIGPGSATPLFLHDGTLAGSGKGKLGNLAAMIATGTTAPIQPAEGGDEAEWRKRLTSHIQAAAPIVMFDNVDRPVSDPTLCAMLTSESVWKDRLLGTNRVTAAPIVSLFIVTGNNIVLRGDILRRVVPIRLVPDVERPDLKPLSSFKYPELLLETDRRRGELLGAVLTMCTAWFEAGCPIAEAPVLGSFEMFCKQVGGILAYAGAPAWLSNQVGYRDDQDEDRAAWRAFIHEWYRLYHDQRKTVTELGPVLFGAEDDELARPLREALPPEFVHVKETADRPKLFGRALLRKKDQIFGDLVLRLAVGKSRTGSNQWFVAPAPLHRQRPDHLVPALKAAETQPPDEKGSTFGEKGSTPESSVELKNGHSAAFAAFDAFSLDTHARVSISAADAPVRGARADDPAENAGAAIDGPKKGIKDSKGSNQSQNGLDRDEKKAAAPERKAAKAAERDVVVEPDVRVTRAEVPTPESWLIAEPGELDTVLQTLLASSLVAIDTETTGLDPLTNSVRLVQLAAPGQPVLLVDVGKVDARLLAPVFDGGRSLVAHNAVFDVGFLLHAGINPGYLRVHDTMLVEQVLEASAGPFSKNGWYELQAVVARRLDMALPKTMQLSDWSGELSQDQLEYAARDASALLLLAEGQAADLKAAGLTRIAELEGRASPAVAWLELNGCPIDAELWRQRADEAVTAKYAALQRLTELSGRADLFGGPALNWSSPVQVLELLQARGHDIDSTAVDELARLAVDDPVAAVLMEYREADRRSSSYGVEYVARHQTPVDGRLHPRYHLMGAGTGRMSCGEPNVQQIPHSAAYRSTIAAGPRRAIVKADYSQLELRIAADIARDKTLIAAYGRGEDAHKLTASLVLDVPQDEVSKSARQQAKALNFGLIYGMGAPKLREHALQNYGVAFTLEQAVEFRERFFSTYAGLKRWHRSQTDGSTDTRTPAGRRRLNVDRFTEKLSSPVQGTGADGIKGALALCWERRADAPDARLILAVHDELVAECPVETAPAVAAWLQRAMVDAMQPWLKHIPVEVEVTIGRDWAGTPLAVGQPEGNV
jgi:DNA polymerase I-like protein with 3'-5' exonuclease and polymerase domains